MSATALVAGEGRHRRVFAPRAACAIMRAVMPQDQQLKVITRASIPHALEKAEGYRLRTDPAHWTSCVRAIQTERLAPAPRGRELPIEERL